MAAPRNMPDAASDEERTLAALLFYALAFLHALSFLTSNQGGNVFSIALLPACLASIMLSIKYCSSLWPRQGGAGVYMYGRQRGAPPVCPRGLLLYVAAREPI